MPAKVLKRDNPTLLAKIGVLFKDRVFLSFLIIMILLLVSVVVILAIKVRPVDYAVPLRYSTYQGFDALGAWYRVLTYGAFILVVNIMNLILAAIAFDKSRIASFYLILGTVAIDLFGVVIIWVLATHLGS